MPTSFEFAGTIPEPSGDGAPPKNSSSSQDPSDSADRPSNHALIAESTWKAKRGEDISRPLYLSRVEAGFPSPADDYVETTLDLNEALIENETATFFRAGGGHLNERYWHP